MQKYVPPSLRNRPSQDAASASAAGAAPLPSSPTTVHGRTGTWPPAQSQNKQTDLDHLSGSARLSMHGDSFIGVFACLKENAAHVQRYTGASAKGLNNPASKMGFGNSLVESIQKVQPQYVMLFFGNVDININYPFDICTKGLVALSGKNFVDKVYDEYTAFIERKILTRLKGFGTNSAEECLKTVYIAAALMPVIQDKDLPKAIEKYSIKGDRPGLKMRTVQDVHLFNQEERRKMVIYFNKRLEEFCSRFKHVQYVDINPELTRDNNNSFIHPQFLSQDLTNIHVLWEPTIKFWIPHLKEAGLNENSIKSEDELMRASRDYAGRRGK
ncbi:hypothetical protein CXG81DRAFT_16789 [Caulochytrium protostelioides]|uniref:Uncharacterized protein n=1 Tax=Caulochytrium protostelioides TaxID=1555241 RepID=A0A4P9XDX8_9FUNG|nr:hypothetical protein CXG81DRAFT_16789 [Caulochytrium protostelioides]|eukprot:RKP03688.1 hypothetical protein CXG81DRAFT_16789 [Caulochytrium protostelioides]